MNYDDVEDDLGGGEVQVSQSVPDEMKGLRACIICLLVKTYTQFYNDGCPNCNFMDWGEREIVEGATTKNFEGLVAMMQPKDSWVAKWQRIDRFVPGTYAIKVNEEASEEVQEHCREAKRRNLGKLSMEENA
ncbi:Transcription elongation factor SPT4 [Hondaea fermentalgiana]|uniref:Transcription elongation factor SPT4 n=1 Tax=Hondaea fermentalgiana TaxID=2315210 RepID=A0A2R5GJ72_9STRA|nr:Transcription elongation factor SPT4 [Hondaea fermentalgiana]|eukprot:GBG30937.1 Transcription elongation factor SPT4 [Hondaea fermentalgiana]